MKAGGVGPRVPTGVALRPAFRRRSSWSSASRGLVLRFMPSGMPAACRRSVFFAHRPNMKTSKSAHACRRGDIHGEHGRDAVHRTRSSARSGRLHRPEAAPGRARQLRLPARAPHAPERGLRRCARSQSRTALTCASMLSAHPDTSPMLASGPCRHRPCTRLHGTGRPRLHPCNSITSPQLGHHILLNRNCDIDQRCAPAWSRLSGPRTPRRTASSARSVAPSKPPVKRSAERPRNSARQWPSRIASINETGDGRSVSEIDMAMGKNWRLV